MIICDDSACICLCNTRNTKVTLPHLRDVHHLASYTDSNGAVRMVQLSLAREGCSGVASVEITNMASGDCSGALLRLVGPSLMAITIALTHCSHQLICWLS